jgi:hypothetical protein
MSSRIKFCEIDAPNKSPFSIKHLDFSVLGLYVDFLNQHKNDVFNLD